MAWGGLSCQPDNKRLYVFSGDESRRISQTKADFFASAEVCRCHSAYEAPRPFVW